MPAHKSDAALWRQRARHALEMALWAEKQGKPNWAEEYRRSSKEYCAHATACDESAD